MQVCGREFGPQLLQRIQQTVDQAPDLSRRALSRLVCEWLNWRTALDRLKEVSCRVALLKLHRRGALDLPAVAPAVVSLPRPLPARRGPQPIMVTEASLQALQPVSLRPIEQADCSASRLWNQMMERYHYLGAGPLCGAQMRYAVHSRQGEWLGGLAFSGAAWQLAARDEWIGWSDQARREHLQQVIANSRFLILPHWRVHNLASHVLSLALQASGRQLARTLRL